MLIVDIEVEKIDMPTVAFTQNLKEFFPDLKETKVSGKTVREVVLQLDKHFPGLADYIVDEQGHLRKHVNIFIGEQPIQDRKNLDLAVDQDASLFVFQALSGG